MTRLLFAWELGGGFGHLAMMRTLADAFAAGGAHCEFAVRDVDGAGQILDPARDVIHQAPLSFRSAAVERQSNYAGLLQQNGWFDATALAARVGAWRTLIHRSRCTMLVADHAPTALLAARLAGVPVAMYGIGFAVPPRRQPFPAFGPADEATLIACEAVVLETANQALTRLGGPPLPTLQSLFEPATMTGLFTYAELDHYAPRKTAHYLGTPRMSRGRTVEWGSQRQARVLAYLRPFQGLDALMQALSRLPAQVVVRVDGLPAAALSTHLRPGLVVTDQAVDLEAALAGCDVCINLGQHGTVAEMLLAGKPGLLLPGHREQQILSENVAHLGAARVMPTAVAYTADDYRQAVQHLLDEPKFAAQAQAFSARYADHDRDRKLADWCADCLRQAAPVPTDDAHGIGMDQGTTRDGTIG